jgi:hypothetical protein
MPYVRASLVLETTTTTGTGTLTLAGAKDSNWLTFSGAVGEGNTCSYAITASNGQRETGVGTVVGSTLERTTLISSSTGSKLDLPAGTHEVSSTANSHCWDTLTPAAIGAEPAANITEAARTVLDDTTIAAMRKTLAVPHQSLVPPDGIVPAWSAANSITWSAGVAYVEGTRLDYPGGTLTMGQSDAGLSATGVWHHYLYSASGTPTIELSQTAPVWDATSPLGS